MKDEVSVEDLAAKAKLLAEATGRSEEDIMADLLDDGILNDSHKSEDKDLVTQLREAAELITTVQTINQDISKNSVLNGGENSTNVKVETTLEGDIVDRAIASAQRKADNLKKLAATLIPILLLVTGGSMEAFGIIDIMGSDEGPYDSETVWGCTVTDAENYNPDATNDDGSCWWDDNGGGGGGPPCTSDWWWDNEVLAVGDYDGDSEVDDLRVEARFYDASNCHDNMDNGYFDVWVENSAQEEYAYEYHEVSFSDSYTVSWTFFDLPADDYYADINYNTNDGSYWNGPEAWVTVEDTSCEPQFSHKDSWLEFVSGDNRSLELHMTLLQSNYECDAVHVEFMISGYQDNAYRFSLEYNEMDSHMVSAGETTLVFRPKLLEDLPNGMWSLETRYQPEGMAEDCCFYTAEVEIK